MAAYRKNFNLRTWKSEYVPCEDPELLIKATGEEKVEQNKIKKRLVLTKQDEARAQAEQEEKTHIESVPNEVIHMADDSLIRNFEVDLPEEEEIRFASGVRGIKALRMQRDLINKEIQKPVQIEDEGNKFAAIE